MLRQLLQEYFDTHPKRDVGEILVQQVKNDNVVDLHHLDDKRNHERAYESVFGTPRPKPEHRRLWASVTKSKDAVISDLGAEMKRRDPDRVKTVVCLSDGERALHKRKVSHL